MCLRLRLWRIQENHSSETGNVGGSEIPWASGRRFVVGAFTIQSLLGRAAMHPACFNGADSLRRFALQVSEKRGENVVVAETRVRIPLGPPLRNCWSFRPRV